MSTGLTNPLAHQDIGLTEAVGVWHQACNNEAQFLVKDEGVISHAFQTTGFSQDIGVKLAAE